VVTELMVRSSDGMVLMGKLKYPELEPVPELFSTRKPPKAEQGSKPYL